MRLNHVVTTAGDSRWPVMPCPNSGFTSWRAPMRCPGGSNTGPRCRAPCPQTGGQSTASRSGPRAASNPNARQIREAADCDIPVAVAIDRVDQCVSCPGASSSVLVITASTWSSVIVRGAHRPTPVNRSITNRDRHFDTFVCDTPTPLPRHHSWRFLRTARQSATATSTPVPSSDDVATPPTPAAGRRTTLREQFLDSAPPQPTE